MSRQSQRNGEKGSKAEEQKRSEMTQPTGFPMQRVHRINSNPRERETRPVQLSRQYLNDLYERSSI